ncbi:MAG: class I SAM-dependent methyltransferase [Myxococcota bacterium]
MPTPHAPTPATLDDAPAPKGDLSVTALYTSETWRWAGFEGAELLATPDSRNVFRVTNFVLGIARLFVWRIGSLRTSLAQRHAMLDHLAKSAGADCVFELASGLSRRGVALSADPSLRYTEVDLPPMVARKRALLERTPEGRAVLARPGFQLVGADVTDADLAALAPAGGHLLVIAEGLLMYLDAAAQRALWQRIAALADGRRALTLLFDFLPSPEEPRPGPIGRALAWLMKRFTGGQGFVRDTRDRQDITEELRGLGYAEVSATTPADVAEAWALPYPAKPGRQVIWRCRTGRAELPAA